MIEIIDWDGKCVQNALKPRDLTCFTDPAVSTGQQVLCVSVAFQRSLVSIHLQVSA
jgi:hypothetical protein